METNDLIWDITEHCLAVRTLSAARAITRSYDTALRSVDLTITQFTLLAATARMQPESISDLANRLSLERTSLSRNLKPLEAMGFIERFDEGTARRRGISITPSGRSKLEEAYPYWQQAQRDTEVGLTMEFGEIDKVLSALRGRELL